MKTIKQNIILFLIALVIVTGIIKCQKAQRRCTVDIEELKSGQHKAVYYDYIAYQKGGK